MRGEWTDVVWLCIPAHARLYLLDLSIFSALNKKSLTHLERSDGRKSIILRLRQCSNKLQARNPNVEMYYHLGREWKFRPSLWVITRTGDKGGRRVRDSRIGRERTDAMLGRKQTTDTQRMNFALRGGLTLSLHLHGHQLIIQPQEEQKNSNFKIKTKLLSDLLKLKLGN